MTWKPYSSGFRAYSSAIEIYITENYFSNPDRWVMNCQDLGFDKFQLPVQPGASIDEAMRAAEKIVKQKTLAILQVLLE